MGFEIAIDGPGGSGKSTLAKILAKELGFIYVDTGAMYRSVALYAMRKNVNLENEEQVVSLLGEIDIDIKYIDGLQHIFLNGEDVTGKVRTAEAGAGASTVGVYAKVRGKLVEIQRAMAQNNNVVMDGRDIGTHVLPNADVKVYLDADAGVRAKRRCAELENLGLEYDYEKIKQEIIFRDHTDMTRKVTPLRKADDAMLVDTSSMDPDNVRAEIVKIVRERGWLG